jgi:hypothetical protein
MISEIAARLSDGQIERQRAGNDLGIYAVGRAVSPAEGLFASRYQFYSEMVVSW